MYVLTWVIQILGALLYASSATMKLFMFEKISHDVPSFGALPRKIWAILGGLELICTVGLIVPAALNWLPILTPIAALILAMESLLFIWVHIKYREQTAIVMSSALGLLMGFVAYARFFFRF